MQRGMTTKSGSAMIFNDLAEKYCSNTDTKELFEEMANNPHKYQWIWDEMKITFMETINAYAGTTT